MARPRKTDKVSRIIEILRQLIVTRRYPPSAILSENQLVQDLSKHGLTTSRVPVRQALERLANEGFVRTIPKVGTMVQPQDDDLIRQILCHREILEEFIACELARQETIDLLLARQVNEEMQQLAGRGSKQQGKESDPDEFVRLDMKFHETLANLAKYPTFAAELHTLRSRLHQFAYPNLYSTPDRMTRVVSEHEMILNSIRPFPGVKGDPIRVSEAVHLHLANSIRRWKFSKQVEEDLPDIFKDVPLSPVENESEISRQDREKLRHMREEIETWILEELAASDVDLRPVEDLQQHMVRLFEAYQSPQQKITNEDRTQFINLDIAFHMSLARVGRYRFLSEPIRHIWLRMYRIARGGLTYHDQMRQVIKEHADILAAIRSHKPQSAKKAIRLHLRKAAKRWDSQGRISQQTAPKRLKKP